MMKITKCSLTKHLYRIDEVISSLRWAILTKNLQETAFWTLELYESNSEQDCIELLESIWIHHIGFGSWFALRLIQSIYEEGAISKEILVQIACAFARLKTCDSTVFHLLLRGASTSSEWKPRFPHSKEYLKLEDAVVDCLQRGKLTEAWLLGRGLPVEDQWTLLEDLANKKGRNDELTVIRQLVVSEREKLASAYVLIHLDQVKWSESQVSIENKMPIEVNNAISQWSNEASMRKRREMKPKPEGIMYLARRSEQSVYESSEPEIQGGLEKTLLESEYWSEILGNYMKERRWISSIHKETFYDKFFPQDIPDEWSLADREKSHGRGLGKTLSLGRTRFIHYTLQRSKSIELWNSQFPTDIDCSMDWDVLYEDLREKVKIELPLKPLRKIWEITP
jgi:hypothetical protein